MFFSHFRQKMYRAAIAASARNGILLHGSLDALFEDYRAIARIFEMYIADMLSLERGVTFRLWDHLDREIKDARGMSHGDTGIDVTDGIACIAPCVATCRESLANSRSHVASAAVHQKPI